MYQRLIDWGYCATVEACRTWLAKYRLGPGGIDGNASVYPLSRQDLQRWYYVDQLTEESLQKKYYAVYGVRADRKNLVSWLQADAQKPEKLEFNECIHSHAAGEYVLKQLQNGKTAEYVVEQLMSRYLVEATCQRVAAYRCYREQLGTYWTMRRLERMQWEYLYGLVTIDTKYGAKKRQIRPTRLRSLLVVRRTLCASMQVAEELIPLKVFDEFFTKHEAYARLSAKYPQACILKLGS